MGIDVYFFFNLYQSPKSVAAVAKTLARDPSSA